MIDILYSRLETCSSLGFNETSPECDEYEASVADAMQDESLDVFFGFLGIIFSALGGFTLLFWGFGVASERMNKRIRDQAFTSLLRQEVRSIHRRSTTLLLMVSLTLEYS